MESATLSGAPAVWLAQTKFHPPRLRDDVLPRPRLLAALRDALASHPLTLLSAPAGYGKTTLLGEWVHATAKLQTSNFKLQTSNSKAQIPDSVLKFEVGSLEFSWLSLDEDDNDPIRFLAAVVAALQRLNPAFGLTVQASLAEAAGPLDASRSDMGARMRRVAVVLINDILETLPEPFVLILDDLHLITAAAAFVALDYLVERLPPQMRLVATTRHDPPLALARLRARGQLAELRLADLCFTHDEAAEFLNDRLRLDLSPDDLLALEARTEGWAVGLRLTAGSLDGLPTASDRADFIARLARTERHAFDFLAGEVLDRQPPDARAFLLQTSILAELTPALCQAVTGRDDAETLLEDLYHRNLFLVVVDAPSRLQGALTSHFALPTSHFYRYHALFAEFLRERLQREMPERAADLHQRAARALAPQSPERAFAHFVAAERWESAAGIVLQMAPTLLEHGLTDTLRHCINALPESVRGANHYLLLFLGLCAMLQSETDAAQSHLERALRGFEASGDEFGQGAALSALAGCAMLQADVERCGALAGRALTYPVLLPVNRVAALMGRFWHRLSKGEWEPAQTDLAAALAIATETGDPMATNILTLQLTPPLAALPGGFEIIENFCRRVMARIGDQVSPLQAVIRGKMAFVHFWRGRLAEAIQLGESALALSERFGGYPVHDMGVTAWLAVAHAARGDYAAADRSLEAMATAVKRVPADEILAAHSLCITGRTRWLEGRPDAARAAYAQMLAAEDPRESVDSPALRAILRGLLEMAGPSAALRQAQDGSSGRSRHYAEAERSLRRAVDLERKVPLSTITASARLMLAHLYQIRNRPDEALAELSPILAGCQRDGTPGFILKEGQPVVVPLLRLAVERNVHAEYAAHVLDLLGMPGAAAPVRVPETGETLTPREVEILRLIAAGDDNRAIAAKLVISLPTVKSHVASLLRKLNVGNRTQAAAHARGLRLL